MADAVSRTIGGLTDVVAVEKLAPGMVRVVTVADAYDVDVREGRCTCPDHQYREAKCKHIRRAEIEADLTPVPIQLGIDDDLDQGDHEEPHCPMCAGDGPGCFEAFEADGEAAN